MYAAATLGSQGVPSPARSVTSRHKSRATGAYRPQLVPDREVMGVAERGRAFRSADDREPAEVDAVGRAVDLDEPMLTAAT